MIEWKNKKIQKNRLLYTGRSSSVYRVEKITGLKIKKGKISLPPEPLLVKKIFDQVGPSATAAVQKWYVDWLERSRIKERIKQGNLAVKLPCTSKVLLRALRSYQVVGARVVTAFKHCLLADEVGLGKTIQALASLKPKEKILIVAPAYLVYKWADEIIKWNIQLPAYLCVGSAKVKTEIINTILTLDDFILVVGYPILRTSKTTWGQSYARLRKIKWDHVIFDECHRLQHRQSLQSAGAMELKTEKLTGLTATPIPRGNPAGLWTFLHIADPKRFSSYWRFQDRYTERNEWNKYLGLKNKEEFQAILKEFMFRRTSKEVIKDLPKEMEEVIWLTMHKKHEALYKEVERTAIIGDKTHTAKVALLTKLQLLANYPASQGCADHQPMTDRIIEMIRDMPKPIAILGKYKAYIKSLAETLTNLGVKLGFDVGYVHSGLSPQERYAVINKMRLNPNMVLVGNFLSMKEGIDIEFINNVIFLEVDWSPVTMTQIKGRFNRPLLNKIPTNFFFLLVRDTVQEDVYATWKKHEVNIKEILVVQEIYDRLLRRIQK